LDHLLCIILIFIFYFFSAAESVLLVETPLVADEKPQQFKLTQSRSCDDFIELQTFCSSGKYIAFNHDIKRNHFFQVDNVLLEFKQTFLSDFSFAGSNEKEEAEWFDFLSTQLSRKNINPDSDTCSMIGFDELLRMKKKSSLDSRATIHQVRGRTVVIATPEPTADSSTPVHHQQGGRTLTPSRSCDDLVATSTFCSSGKLKSRKRVENRFKMYSSGQNRPKSTL